MKKPTLKELKSEKDDIEKVGKWLDIIGEYDQKCREEVISQCRTNLDARAYYVGRYENG